MSNEKRTSTTGFEVAIIGMSGRFPGAQHIEEFWENLKNGVETISFFTDQELEESGIKPDTPEKPDYIKAKGIIEDIEYFDPGFFGYTHMEAEKMDPQIRILHECTWHALEDAGYDPGAYKGLIGFYVGATNNASWQNLIMYSGISSSSEGFASMQLCDKDHISTRISYKLNLNGPSFTLETQCSTSLVAIHLACQGLLSGECDIALAGGISIMLPKKKGYMYQEGMVDSQDGHCRPFDANASGTVFGAGAGLVVLKRLNEATADRDNIYALIKGSAINNDGNRKVGYTAPSVEGQTEVIRAAQQMAEVEPESIGYIEAHGTGTTLGDPIEIEALTQAFNTSKKGYCRIGSVKSNLGHLADAAGVAGLIKTVLALKHQLIPPSLHFDKPNSKINFEDTPFYVNNKLTQWKSDTYPLRAGVSSFGIGGTNAHVVLEEAPEGTRGLAPLPIEHSTRQYRLILLSAKTQSALDTMTGNLAEYFKKNLLNRDNHENLTNPGLILADAAYTLMKGRKAFKKRRMLVCSTLAQASAALENHDQGKMQTGSAVEENKHVVFMFSGQGPQYVHMGWDLYQTEKTFQGDVHRCLEILKSIFGYDVTSILYPGKEDANKEEEKSRTREGGENKIDDVIYSGPIKFIMDYSLARLLMRWGIRPSAMIGHSFGEYVAACLSGVFSLEDALRLVVLRGQLMAKTPPGIMMSVPLPEKEIKTLLKDDVSLAAVNTSSLCIVSGPTTAVESLENHLKERGHECVRLNFPHASHSKMIEPILEEFKEYISRLKRNKPRIPYISNLTGTWITAEQAVDPAYYAAHMRQPVRFADGITELLKNPHTVFIQVGPGRGLTLFVEQHPDKHPGQLVIHLLRHHKEKISDTHYLFNQIGQLWISGVNIDWSAFYADEKRYRTPLPSYPFTRQRHWKYVDDFLKRGKIGNLERKKDITAWFYVPAWKPTAWPAPRHLPGKTPAGTCWLVFMDECGIGAKLVKRLQRENHDIIRVMHGTQFAKLNDHEFIINPREDENYDILFGELRALKKKPANILHLWGVTKSNHQEQLDVSLVEKTQDLGFYSLINLAKSIGGQDFKDKLTIGVVTNNMQEFYGYGEGITSPGKATVLGPVRVIPIEYPNINCFSIDIVIPGPGSRQESGLTDRLISEFTAEPSRPVIVYRGSHRLEESFAPIQLNKSNGFKSRLREGGVYLVIGGLGGVGLVLAEYLVKTVRARLILVGRSAFPAREDWEQWLSHHDEEDSISLKIRKIQEFEKSGARVLVLSADVSNQEQMQQLVTRSEKQFGCINGVIHSAMVVDGAVIPRRTRQWNQKVIAPKVPGTIILDRIFSNKQLDFFVICSSIASFLGSTGEVGYCAANAFQDAFVLHKNHRDDDTFYMSINWDAWQEVGQAAKTARKFSEAFKTKANAFVEHGILPKEGKDVFERIMDGDFHQVAISTRDLNVLSELRYEKRNEESTSPEELEETPEREGALRKRPELSTGYIAPVNKYEKLLVDLWQNFFGIEPVGTDDNFFELGGDSLKAMIVSATINKKMSIKVSVTSIFSNPTIKELARYIAGGAEKVKYSSIEPAEKREYYALSSAQKRLYVLQQMEKNNTGYNEILPVVLEGDLQGERLEETVGRLIKRHEILRTSFEMLNGEPVQRVHEYEEVDFTFEYHDFSETRAQHHGLPGLHHQGTGHTGYINRAGFIRPFDLSQAPLLRIGVIKIAPEQHIFIADMHHIAADGTSQGVFAEEFMALYTGGELPVPRVQYKDFSEWQNRQKEEKNQLLKRQETYWLKELAGDLPVLELPTDYERPGVQSFEGWRLGFEIGKEEAKALKKLAEEQGTSLFMVILSIYSILLARISSQEDIVVGTPTAGRGHPDTSNIMGMLINTLALRNYPRPERTFKEFLEEVKQRTLEAFENQDYPFEDLVEKVEVKRDASRNPIFDVVLVFHNYIVESADIPEIQAASLNLTSCQYENPTTKFDFILHVKDRPNQPLLLIVEYCTKLFSKESIERFMKFFINIVRTVTENPDRKISEIEILDQEEKERLLKAFNINIDVQYPSEKTLYELFAEQVERVPDHIALLGKEKRGKGRRVEGKKEEEPFGRNLNAFGVIHLSYKQLNERFDQLARVLIEKGVKPDNIVAIMMERSVEMIIGILGILKAGGAYLPLDPDYPKERIDYMLTDSNAKVLLAELETQQPPRLPLQFIDIETELASAFNPFPSTSTCQVSPANLAYIIYTSGTTGKPKGTLIQQGNVVRLLFNDQFQFDFNGSDVWTLFHSFCFDFSVWEMYGALLYGGKLVLVPRKIARNPYEFREILKQETVTVLNQTPAAFYNLANVETSIPGPALKLRYVIFGGEALAPIKLKEWREKYPKTKLINMYGITETTVHVTYKELTDSDVRLNISNIGNPLPTLSTYVMDKNQALVPMGVAGELCVGGKGVARGYLNQPELTAKKFCLRRPGALFEKTAPGPRKNFLLFPSPTHLPYLPYSPIYRSGDLVRLLENGEMEYLGRIDHQVKIRGFRIELEEIQHQLLKHDKVKEAIVLPLEERGKDRYLCAYIVSNNELGSSELREYLSLRVPDYMIPAYFIPIDEVHLPTRGKIDRKVLASIAAASSRGEKFTPPKTNLEKIIADAWKKILRMDTIGITDNYFDIGGNSINILNLSLELEKVLDRNMHVAKLFQYPTIASFARHLEREKEIHIKDMDEKKQVNTRDQQFEDVKNRIKKRRKRDMVNRDILR